LCGPAGMVTAVEAVAAELGVPAGQVEAERFTAA
jgi:ferredoxin-NADP reductase